MKKAALKNNIHKETVMLESLFNKVAGLKVWNFVLKRLQHRCFPVNMAKFLRAPVMKNTCERLLLQKGNLRELILKEKSIKKRIIRCPIC